MHPVRSWSTSVLDRARATSSLVFAWTCGDGGHTTWNACRRCILDILELLSIMGIFFFWELLLTIWLFKICVCFVISQFVLLRYKIYSATLKNVRLFYIMYRVYISISQRSMKTWCLLDNARTIIHRIVWCQKQTRKLAVGREIIKGLGSSKKLAHYRYSVKCKSLPDDKPHRVYSTLYTLT